MVRELREDLARHDAQGAEARSDAWSVTPPTEGKHEDDATHADPRVKRWATAKEPPATPKQLPKPPPTAPQQPPSAPKPTSKALATTAKHRASSRTPPKARPMPTQPTGPPPPHLLPKQEERHEAFMEKPAWFRAALPNITDSVFRFKLHMIEGAGLPVYGLSRELPDRTVKDGEVTATEVIMRYKKTVDPERKRLRSARSAG